jgi:hypothetical protein
MNSDAHERLMILLATDCPRDPSICQDAEGNEIDEMIADAASLMASLTGADSDLVSSAVWQQVAADDRRARGCTAGVDLSPELWDSTEIYPDRR